jgi:Uma2 family endonuclease
VGHKKIVYNFGMTAFEQTMTEAQYLEFEKTSLTRHEFVDGRLIAMAGEKRRHNKIAGRVYALLLERVAALQCEIAFENVKVRTLGTKYRYPDVVVSCAPGNNEYYLENPCFVLEVLSHTTYDTDFGIKLDEYKSIASLSRYLILSQNSAFAVLYKRNGEKWEVETFNGSGEIDIPCLETTLQLEQIYNGLLPVQYESPAQD